MTDRLTDRELQALRNMGNECERAAEAIENLIAANAALSNAVRDLLLWVDTSREGPSKAAEKARAAMQRRNT